MLAAAQFDITVRLAIQQAFLDGRPTPTVESVARDVHAEQAEVSAAFDRLAAGHVIVLAPGSHEIAMSAPFAGRPTDFVVTIGEHTYHANCVWDALGIPAMLAGVDQRVDADVRTHCADCGATLAIAIRQGTVASDTFRAVAHFAVRASRWWDDIAYT